MEHHRNREHAYPPALTQRSAAARWDALLESYDGPRKVSLMMARIGVSDPNSRVRNLAAEILGEIGTRLDAYRIKHLLNDSSWIVRSSAVDALNRVLGHKAQPIHIGMLHDSHYIVRRDAAIGLGHLGFAESIPILADRLVTEANVQAKLGLLWSLIALGKREYLREMVDLSRGDFLGIRTATLRRVEELLDLGPLAHSEIELLSSELKLIRDLDNEEDDVELLDALEARLEIEPSALPES